MVEKPLSNRDWESGSEIMNILDNLLKRGRTLIIVTHDAHTAGRGERPVNLVEGRVERQENNHKR